MGWPRFERGSSLFPYVHCGATLLPVAGVIDRSFGLMIGHYTTSPQACWYRSYRGLRPFAVLARRGVRSSVDNGVPELDRAGFEPAFHLSRCALARRIKASGEALVTVHPWWKHLALYPTYPDCLP